MLILLAERVACTSSLDPCIFASDHQAVVLGEECTRAKPFPDPYLEGMRLLGLRPEETLVVEDSPAGIKVCPHLEDW